MKRLNCFNMHFTSDFRERLLRLRDTLKFVLDYDASGHADVSLDLLPYLFADFARLFFYRNNRDILKK